MAFAKSPPPGSGSGDVPANILIMLDTSGSMDDEVPTGDTRYPADIAFGPDGSVYIAKYYDYVEKYSSTGAFETRWGGHSSSGTNGKFEYTFALDVDSGGNVFVSDYDNNRVQKFDANGDYISKITLTAGPAKGLALDSSDNLYVVNGNGKVEKYNSAGTYITKWTNTTATHITVDSSNNIYTTCYSGKKIEKYNTSGVLQSSFTLAFKPYGIDADASGNLYITDKDNDKIYKYSPAGVKLATYGSSGSSSGKFNNPEGVAVRPSTDIAYIADYSNHRIQAASGGTFLTITSPETLLDQAKRVVKQIVSNSDLTDSANFGLVSWNSSATMKVKISSTGAASIYSTVDSLSAGGGTELDYAMTLAKTYFLGATSPRVDGAECQQNIIIVISDGFWDDTTASATAQQLYEDYNIKTFTVGFMNGGNENYETLSVAGGTYPDSPLFASNWQQLYDILAAYIQQISIANLTFTAPTIIPGVVGEDFIVQSTFTYKRDHQWKGRLKKYSLTDSGEIGDALWDAGDVLNTTAADSRHLWTVGTALTTSLNNFTTTNSTRLKPGLEENLGSSLSDTQIDALIEFVRGKDSYSEFPGGTDDEGDVLLSGERWKLGDIYHSRALVVSAPSAFVSETANANTDAHYRFANGYNSFKSGATCGGVCTSRSEIIVAGGNDGILHAFNSSTGAEMWGFIPPSVLPVLKDMRPSTTADETNSIFSVDGSPTVKDIYYSGAWHTILMAGLRQGGHSYFALDITDVSNPQHLFTFDYNTLNNTVSYWEANGTRTTYTIGSSTIPAEYDYTDVGEAWSQPVIVRLPIGTGGADKWVALVAGGYNNALNPDYGANLYILDLEDGGKVLHKIDLPDTDSSNGIVNSLPPRLTVITPETTSTFTKTGAFAYVTDLEGKLWKINLTNEGTLYETTRIFDAQSTSTNNRYVFFENTPSVTSDGRLIHFFGTGNLMSLETTGASIQNRAYGVYDNNYPAFTSMTPITVSSLVNAAGTCPDNIPNGWYMNFGANEKLTGRITVDSNTLFMSRFVPNASDICSGGTALLGEYNFECGTTVRETDLGNGIATDAVIYKGKIYMGISSDAAVAVALPDGFSKVGNLIVGTPSQTAAHKVTVESWWEEF
jgi:type IV pilus assembly protein PilY1